MRRWSQRAAKLCRPKCVRGRRLPSATLPIDAGVSDAAALARPAAVVRNGRHVTNCGDLEPDALQCAECRLAPGAGSGNLDLKDLHAVLDRLLAGVLCGDLGRVRRRLARALEPHRPSRGPGYGVALGIGYGDHRVVEARADVGHAGADVLALLAAHLRAALLLSSHMSDSS